MAYAFLRRTVAQVLLLLVLNTYLCLSTESFAQDRPPEVGLWVAPGGDAVLEVGVQANTLRLTLVRALDSTLTDTKNPEAALRDRPLAGIELSIGLTRQESGWGGGKLYDPGTGNTYKLSLQLLDEDHLRLRGYVGLRVLGRSQTWVRYALFKQRMLRMLEVSETDSFHSEGR